MLSRTAKNMEAKIGAGKNFGITNILNTKRGYRRTVAVRILEITPATPADFAYLNCKSRFTKKIRFLY